MKGKPQTPMLVYVPFYSVMAAVLSLPKNLLFARNGSMFYMHLALVKQKLFRSWRYFVLPNDVISI